MGQNPQELDPPPSSEPMFTMEVSHLHTRTQGPLLTLSQQALLSDPLTCDIGTHSGQRGQVGGAEGCEPPSIHLGCPIAPEELILEE